MCFMRETTGQHFTEISLVVSLLTAIMLAAGWGAQGLRRHGAQNPFSRATLLVVWNVRDATAAGVTVLTTVS
jgi:hypothetical protein